MNWEFGFTISVDGVFTVNVPGDASSMYYNWHARPAAKEKLRQELYADLKALAEKHKNWNVRWELAELEGEPVQTGGEDV